MSVLQTNTKCVVLTRCGGVNALNVGKSTLNLMEESRGNAKESELSAYRIIRKWQQKNRLNAWQKCDRIEIETSLMILKNNDEIDHHKPQTI